MGLINAEKKLKNNKNIQEAGLGALAHDQYYWALMGAYFTKKKLIMGLHKSPKNTQNNVNMLIMGSHKCQKIQRNNKKYSGGRIRCTGT